MTITAHIEDRTLVAQPVGFEVRVRYHDSVTNTDERLHHRINATAVYHQAFVDQIAEVKTAKRAEKELRKLRDHVRLGGAISDMVLYYNTDDDALAYLVKALFNKMRDAETRKDKLTELTHEVSIIDPHTNGKLASLIGWSVSDVVAARGKLNALRDAVQSLDHGQSEIS